MQMMGRRKIKFRHLEPWPGVTAQEWRDWKWQLRKSLKTQEDFSRYFDLTPEEVAGFTGADQMFRVQTTPYYASLSDNQDVNDPIRRMILPHEKEMVPGLQQMLDPLGERKQSNRAAQRLIHRYTDRALFLATDVCGVYCRYCTRKHFTASDQVMATDEQLHEAVTYVKAHPEIKEVIFSGGDPLTIGNSKLGKMLKAFYEIDTLELIRIGSRMPVVNPFRIDNELIDLFKEYKPVYLMTHFNHPDELSEDSAQALERFVDNGVPVFNQLVLLNGINNHPALIYALSRRLLYLRVKPYYMFQADPSLGTDHLRTSIENSLDIQRQLWGHTSGLAMPTYIVDIPDGGGKTALTPNFLKEKNNNTWSFEGWDGVKADYVSPIKTHIPDVNESYQQEWLKR
jgi:lysine 2,3-aminomutase